MTDAILRDLVDSLRAVATERAELEVQGYSIRQKVSDEYFI